MTYSHLDQRPAGDKEADLTALNLLQEVLENTIASYALENPEDLYDEEHQEIVRKLEFSQGTRSYCLVLCPDGFLRMIEGRFPIGLLINIHNALIDVLLTEQSLN